ncbi:MAG: radical SAM protein [Acidimicrobiia bacterium]
MRIELIVPATQHSLAKRKKAVAPPLGLATVAALTPPDVDVSLTDENIGTVDFQIEADLVGITSLTTTALRAYRIADEFRSRGVKVAMGGIHASVLPEEASEHADAVVVGEAEETWPALIEDLKNNRLRPVYKSEKHPALTGLPIPRRELYADKAYYIKNTISASRGCPYACSFCSVSLLFGRPYRHRPVEEIIQEIRTLDRRSPILFVDDNIVGSPDFAKELFRALIPLKIRWLAQSTVTMAKDEELLRLASASGCVGVFIGFESLSSDSLAALGKKVNAAEKFEDVIRKIHSHGIAIQGSFIVGLDEDDDGVFAETLRFAQETRLEVAGFSAPTPLPGTALHQTLDEAGRIVTKDWSRYESEIVFEPKQMSRQALWEGAAWASREFFSLPSIWRRIGIRHRHLPLMWGMNLVWRTHYRNRF